MSSILEKVRKLFAHAESAGQLGNQAEAEAFAAKAQALLDQHKIDAALVHLADDTPDELVDIQELGVKELYGTTGAAGWRNILFNGLAKAHFCRLIKTCKGTFALVGAKSDREVVLYLLAQLLRVAPRLAAEAVPEPISRYCRTTRADRNAWLLGFASGISAKLREARERAQNTNPNALVLVSAQKRVDDAYRAAFPNARSLSGPRSYGAKAAFEAGKEAGRAYNVAQGVRGSRGAAGHVTGGSLRLGSGR